MRGIPHLEATDDLFLHARVSGAEDTPQEQAEPARKPRQVWRSLRLERLQGLDAQAQVPPPLLPLPTDAAIDVAEPEPVAPPPSAEDLEIALSEAVDLPDDWAMVVAQAGGTNVAHCLRELLVALDWNGVARQVAEALPPRGTALDGAGVKRVMARLGYRCRTFRARLNDLGPQDFPALFVPKNGDAIVLKGFGRNSFPGFDGASRNRRPIARDRRAGWVFAFSSADGAEAVDPPLPASAMGLLWAMLGPRAKSLAMATVAQGALALAGPLLLLVALDHAVPAGSLPMTLFFAGAAGLALIFEQPFRAWRDRIALPAATASGSLALRALARTVALSPGMILDTTVGARRARYEEFQAGGAAAVMRITGAVLGMIAASVGLAGIAVLGGVLAIVPVCGLVLMALTAWMLRGGLRKATARAVRAAGALTQHWRAFAEVRGAIVDTGGEVVSERRLEAAAADAAQSAGEAVGRTRAVAIVSRWLAWVGVAVTAAVGGQLAVSDGMSPGALAASVLLSWSVLAAGARLAATAGDAARLWCGLTQARQLQGLPGERPVGLPAMPPRLLTGHVDVSGLSTGATGGVEAPLDGVSLYADPGEVVAVVGDYQSGKSTLLRVLAGLQTATSGHARLDGVETSLFDPVQLRQSVAYVPETPEFLPLPIEANLRLMNPVASDAEIQAACELAGAMEEIRVMETGVGTHRRFGLEVNMGLFTRDPHPGFLKRVALARGYVRHSGLLLLDGPERQLDPDGEQALLRAIESLRGHSTVIVATDRPQIIRLADRVLWLDGGRPRAEGPSSTVLEQLYAEGRVGQTLSES